MVVLHVNVVSLLATNCSKDNSNNTSYDNGSDNSSSNSSGHLCNDIEGARATNATSLIGVTSLASGRALSRNLNDSQNWITIDSIANIASNVDQSIHTNSKNARIHSANVIVIAGVWSKHTTGGGVTSVDGTVVIIIADNRREVASSGNSTEISSAKIVIVANLGNIEARMGLRVALEAVAGSWLWAGSICAWSAIGNKCVGASKQLITDIYGASVEIIAIDGSEGTTDIVFARIHGTVVEIVANHRRI